MRLPDYQIKQSERSLSLSDYVFLLSPQEAIQLDGEILYALLRRVSVLAHRHLQKQKLEPNMYMTEWFMCVFSRTLPWASVLRVWDMFLCEGEPPKKYLHLYCSVANESSLMCHSNRDNIMIDWITLCIPKAKNRINCRIGPTGSSCV